MKKSLLCLCAILCLSFVSQLVTMDGPPVFPPSQKLTSLGVAVGGLWLDKLNDTERQNLEKMVSDNKSDNEITDKINEFRTKYGVSVGKKTIKNIEYKVQKALEDEKQVGKNVDDLKKAFEEKDRIINAWDKGFITVDQKVELVKLYAQGDSKFTDFLNASDPSKWVKDNLKTESKTTTTGKTEGVKIEAPMNLIFKIKDVERKGLPAVSKAVNSILASMQKGVSAKVAYNKEFSKEPSIEIETELNKLIKGAGSGGKKNGDGPGSVDPLGAALADIVETK